MRIAVAGSGALGLYYGSMLQKAGNEVHFLLRRDYEAIAKKGLVVHSVNGDYRLPEVRGYRQPEEIGRVDLVLVGLKTFANHRFRELIGPLVDRDTLILTLQNGLGNEEELAEIFGIERVMGGVAYLLSNRGEPGVLHHLGEGRVILGGLFPGDMKKVEKVAPVFQAAGIQCRVVSDLKKAKWEKLAWNIPFNGICALAKKPVNEILGTDASLRLVTDMMREIIDAANAQGLENDITISFAEKLVNFSMGLGDYKPSMLIDRLEGRPLELEAIFGKPLTAGKSKGVDMPRVETLFALLRLTENV
jgi:2-dehydropantoate 2-reductase